MECERINKSFADYVMGHIDPEAKRQIETHVSRCSTCQRELDQFRAVWQELEQLPEEDPSPALRDHFYAMLDTYKAGLWKANAKISWHGRLEGWLGTWWPRRPAIQFALSAALLVIGLLLGTRMHVGDLSSQDVGQLHEEIREMRQMVTLSLLRQTSSSDRLQAINLSTRVDKPGESLLSALLQTLNTDPNVNVRLAAVDALYLFRNQPGVRAALVQSLSEQASPLVQISLIDLLVSIRERKSLETLQSLIEDEAISPEVKQHAEWGVEQLI